MAFEEENVDTSTEESVEVGSKEIPLRGTYESAAYKEAKAKGEVTETPVETTVAETETTSEEKPTEEVTETSSATSEQVVENEEDPFLQLSEDVGFEVKSYDDVVNSLKTRRELEQQLTEIKNTLDGLDPLARDLDKAVKSGMDLDQYLHARKLEPEQLQAKDALREKFLLENAQLVKESPDFASKKFEREFNAKYGIINTNLEDVAEEELAVKKDEIEFTKASLEADSKAAKRYLQDWKSKNVTIVEKQQEVAPGVTEEQAAQYLEAYTNQAKEFISAVDAVEIAIGDKTFSYGVENHKKALENDLLNPLETLAKHGVDIQNGKIDPSKFGELLTAYYILQDAGFGKSFSDFSLEQFNKQTVTAKQTGPAPTQPLTGGALPAKTLNQKVGEAFKAEREAKRSGM